MSKPFTVPHFKEWAGRHELDTGDFWKLDTYQSSILADIFKRTPAGLPRYPVVWLVVPEGNGKTTLLAGLALYHVENTPTGYVAVAASTRDQAEWIYRQADGFVKRADRESEFKCLEGYRRIRYDANGSRIQVFAADDRGGDGAIASLFILDELHRHKDLALYRTWAGKLRKRGGQLVAISTAGEAGAEFETERDRFRQTAGAKVRRKGAFVRVEVENAVLHDYALEEGADAEDLAAVKRANPARMVTKAVLAEKRALPGMTAGHWARFTCNRPTRTDAAAIAEIEWSRALATEAELLVAGEQIWAGLDVGWKWDTTAIVPFAMRDPEHRVFGPATVLEPPRDGTSLDPYLVEKAFVRIHNETPIHTVVMDSTRAEQLATWLEHELGVRVIDRSQGNVLASLDYERFMDGLRNGHLKHSGDKDLSSHAFNAIARELPGGKVRFDRPHASRLGGDTMQRRRVIDALVAAAMVHSTAVAELEEIDEELEPMVAFA